VIAGDLLPPHRKILQFGRGFEEKIENPTQKLPETVKQFITNQ